jgi:pyruvate dehydrogenase E1 component alpha subunit
MPDANFCERAESYRIPANRVESGSTMDIHDAAADALGKIRNGGGPQFLECLTARWRDHVGPDEDRVWKYRPDAELDDWIIRDDMARIGRELPLSRLKEINANAEAEIAKAIAFAEASPYPAEEEIFDHVFR